MLRLTKHQKQSRKACKTKAIKENDNAASIVRKLQEAAKKYHMNMLPIKHKNQQQCEVAKGTLKLHTFWEVKKPDEKIDKEVANKDNIEVDNDTNEDSDDEINEYSNNKVEGYNWYNKIPDALKNLELDIKKEKVNSE
ncbi:5466_t:CDS:2, partial [Funneliformis caledonium]